LAVSHAVPAGSRKVTVVFNCISKRTVLFNDNGVFPNPQHRKTVRERDRERIKKMKERNIKIDQTETQ
jgi:hypothetical protein